MSVAFGDGRPPADGWGGGWGAAAVVADADADADACLYMVYILPIELYCS